VLARLELIDLARPKPCGPLERLQPHHADLVRLKPHVARLELASLEQA